ncbi:S8 family peptidase, partial [Salmonella sp. s55044]|uniref:S8 family peptidase n=1 Tax=Salmonella sp. s55044 TaxID=3159677 RepID=UPI00398190B5
NTTEVIMKFLLIALFATAASALVAPLYNAKDRIEGSYIVVLNDGIDVDTSVFTITNSPFFSTFGGRVDRLYKSALNGFSASLSPKALELVRRFNFVKYVQEDQIMNAYAVASWGLDRVDERSLTLNGVYSPRNNGAGVSVYIIDTGINPTHVDYGGRAYTDSSMDFVTINRGGIDCNGHGSHCAGTVGGNTYGVANQVSLFGVRVLSCIGSGSNTGVIGGMDWVAANHVKPAVASMSLGGGANQASDDAVTRMHNAGVTVAVAAGNSDEDASNASPARAPLAITVAASDNTDTRASFSNFGPLIDMFAPGVAITSCWDDSDTASNTISGTSMACPHIAGGAAVLLAENPSRTPTDVVNAMTSEATANVIADPMGSANLLLYVG